MLEHIHVCDSCKKETRVSQHEHGGLMPMGAEMPKGWAHIDLRATVPYKPDTAMTDLAKDTVDILKDSGVSKKARKKYAAYLDKLAGIGLGQSPEMIQRHDHWDLCADCVPQFLGFIVTMNLKSRPVPSLYALPPLEDLAELDESQDD